MSASHALGGVRGLWVNWDAAVSKIVFACARSLGWDIEPVSPSTAHLPAIQSPTPLITSLLLYLAVVTVGCGMVPRRPNANGTDPTWLKVFVILHNLFLILLSLYMCVGCAKEAYLSGYRLWGNEFKASETRLAYYIYIFYVSKIYEFMDTFIMLLKKNLRQVSFLHVYHHSTISFIWWMIARRAPGGDAYFSAALNSWVHVCMYTYYLLSALIGKNDATRSKYLWWGRHLTQLQMLQFFLNLLQALYCASFSVYPKFLSKILLVYMLSLLALFGHFYYLKHMASANLRKKQK